MTTEMISIVRTDIWADEDLTMIMKEVKFEKGNVVSSEFRIVMINIMGEPFNVKTFLCRNEALGLLQEQAWEEWCHPDLTTAQALEKFKHIEFV